MRFCMITTFYPPWSFGGDGIFVQRLSHALVARHHEVTVIHHPDAYEALARPPYHARPPSAPPPIEGLRVEGLRTRSPLLTLIAIQQTGRPMGIAHQLRSVVEGSEFDVIHFHNTSLIGGPAVLAEGHGVKLYTTHEHWLVCPTHVLFKFQRQPCHQKSCLACQLSYRRPPQWWRGTGLMRQSLRHLDALISPSEFTRGRHRRDGIESPMAVIPHFCPDGALLGQTTSQPPTSGRPFFLFGGRLEKLKGLQSVIPTFRDLGDVDLLIAGSGDHEPELRRIAGDAPNIRFLGRVSPEQYLALAAEARAVIVPSIGFETFGQVVIEAFSVGTPVIARRLGPLPELVEAADGGLLFEDTEQFRRCVLSMAHDTLLRQRMSERSRAAFQRHWSEAAHMNRYFSLIEEIRSLRRAGGEPQGTPGWVERLESRWTVAESGQAAHA